MKDSSVLSFLKQKELSKEREKVAEKQKEVNETKGRRIQMN
jgi:hypothetical protein